MTQLSDTAAADFEAFTVRLTRTTGQDELQLTLGDLGGDLSVQITPGDLRTLAGWLTQQATKLHATPRVVMDVTPAPQCKRTGPGECGDENPLHPGAFCTRHPGHDRQHWNAGLQWPQEDARCGAMHNGDDGDDQRCQLPTGHLGYHAVKFGPSWPQKIVPMGGRCGNVKYWPGAQANDPDRRSVCTNPVGHSGSHHGPDQTGAPWGWPRTASCEAGRPGHDETCTLSAGHSGHHENDRSGWPNPLQID